MPGKDWNALLHAARVASSPREFRRLAHEAQQLRARGSSPPEGREIGVALIGRTTRDLIAHQLDLALLVRGFSATLHLSPFADALQQLLDPSSEASCARPHFALVMLTSDDIPEWPQPAATPEEANAAAQRVAHTFVAAARAFRDGCGAEVLIDNFAAPTVRPLGNAGAKIPSDPENFLRRVNVALGDAAPDGVHILDVASLAARYGGLRWRDARLWYEAKQPMSHDLAVEYARTAAGLIAGRLGAARKCAVLDLDDTLWGGVVGDVGVAGIELGEGTPRGEAYKAFQRYLAALRERGVLLAVCSKNDPANARAPFEEHPETVLRMRDFAAFRASWEPKSDNLRMIAEDLALHPNSLVFVDDNPAEREQVRRALPEVAVIELPADPADFPAAVDASRWFEVAEVTHDDRGRADQYGVRAAASALAETMDLSEFLASLEMRARVAPIDALSSARCVQLLNKTNQFNLTTRRFTRGEFAAALEAPDSLARSVRLSDRFGDHGLICVVLATLDGEIARISDWVMSCRVLKRGVESMVLGELVALARARGATELRARFVPSGRNELVRTLLDDLGFERISQRGDEVSYRLPLAHYESRKHFIEVEREARD